LRLPLGPAKSPAEAHIRAGGGKDAFNERMPPSTTFNKWRILESCILLPRLEPGSAKLKMPSLSGLPRAEMWCLKILGISEKRTEGTGVEDKSQEEGSH
jgi:hypothetical protein